MTVVKEQRQRRGLRESVTADSLRTGGCFYIFWVNGFAGGCREVCWISLPSVGPAEATVAVAMGSPENLERRAQESMVCLCPPATVLPWAALRLAGSALLSPGESLGMWASARTWAFPQRKTGVPRSYLSRRGCHGHQGRTGVRGQGGSQQSREEDVTATRA